MTDDQRAAAGRTGACIGRGSVAARSLSTPELAVDPFQRRACSSEAYGLVAFRVGLVEGAGGRSSALLANPPCWSHPRRSRHRRPAREHSGMPGKTKSDAPRNARWAGCESYLDEILAFGLGYQRLQLRRREGVYEASL
jgi:hypothetical protein